MSNRSLACALALGVLMLCTPLVRGANWYVATCGQDFWAGVNPNCIAPLGPKRTIQAAINAASNGDTVFVFPGTYNGTIDLDGKAITIVSTGGAAATILDANGAGPAVLCNSFEGPGTVIEGLTIRDGFTTGSGGGMLIALASPTITECVFDGNEARIDGGAIACTLGSPMITDCHFTQNEADNAGANSSQGNGGAIAFVGGSPNLVGCNFVGNAAKFKGGHVYLSSAAAPDFEDCHFELGFQYTYCPADPDCATSMGAAVASVGCTPEFTGCTFYDNRLGARGAVGVSAGSAAFNGCDFILNRPFNFADPNIDGAALFLANGAQVALIGCTFQDNYSNSSGGAVRTVDSALTATLCGFFDNEAASSVGGAIRATDSDVVLAGCSLSGNTAHVGGGAISAEEGSLTLEGCNFSGNSATVSKGPNGGAILMEGTQMLAGGCTFTGNESTTYGGAICWVHGDDGPTLDPGTVDVGLANCDFVENSGYYGGGLGIIGGNARIVDCLFEDNHMPGPAAGYGAGVFVGGSALAHVEGCQFTGNQATNTGGALAAQGLARAVACSFTGNSALYGGAAGLLINGSLTAVSCVFEGNTATTHGGAFTTGLGNSATIVNSICRLNTAPLGQGTVHAHTNFDGALSIVNSAIVGNTGGGVRNDNASAEVTVANSIVRSNISGGQLVGWSPTVRFSNIQGGAIGQGVIDADPMFINPAVGNYRLLAGSPCIDAGHNWALPQDSPDLDADGNLAELIPFDFDGNPRFANNGAAVDAGCGGTTFVDIGPFETAGVTGPELVPGDTNEDGSVNFNDMVIVLGNWGPCMTPCCPGDVNFDGVVDFNDMVTILGNWN